MRLCWHVFALAVVFFGTPSVAQQLSDGVSRDPQTLQPLIFASNEAKQEESDINTFALMSGKCSKLKVAGRDFPCKAVAFFYSQQGRANFAVALDDPSDDSHVVSFSGENGRREQDDLFELPVDRMLLNSKDRPKVDGLPVPVVELSTECASRSETSRPDRFPVSPAARPIKMAKSMNCSSSPMARQLHCAGSGKPH